MSATARAWATRRRRSASPIAVRALFGYAVLLGLLRASGKRTVEQGTPFDFVFALVLGDMVDDLVWAEVSAARFVAAAGTLTLVHTAVSVAGAWSERFSRLVGGRPTTVLRSGRPRRDGLRKERINDHELERMLRHEGVPREGWSDVKRAQVELSGQPTVRREPWAEALRRCDLPRVEDGRR